MADERKGKAGKVGHLTCVGEHGAHEGLDDVGHRRELKLFGQLVQRGLGLEQLGVLGVVEVLFVWREL